MNTTRQSSSVFFKMILLIACFIIAMLYNQTMATGSPNASGATKTAVNFKNDVGKNELAIRLKSNRGAIMQLFLFSPDGILIDEVAVSAHKTTIIKSLKKGYYLYECFDNDERMKSGSLIIK